MRPELRHTRRSEEAAAARRAMGALSASPAWSGAARQQATAGVACRRQARPGRQHGGGSHMQHSARARQHGSSRRSRAAVVGSAPALTARVPAHPPTSLLCAAEVEAKFAKSAWGQKLSKRAAKAATTDFDRYKASPAGHRGGREGSGSGRWPAGGSRTVRCARASAAALASAASL